MGFFDNIWGKEPDSRRFNSAQEYGINVDEANQIKGFSTTHFGHFGVQLGETRYIFENLDEEEYKSLLRAGLNPEHLIGMDLAISQGVFTKSAIMCATSGQLHAEKSALNALYQGFIGKRELVHTGTSYAKAAEREAEIKSAILSKKEKSKQAKKHLEELINIENPLE
jgi:hypothetical protein